MEQLLTALAEGSKEKTEGQESLPSSKERELSEAQRWET
jgi:hypothetical protein